MTISGINQGMLSLRHKTKFTFHQSKHIDYTSHLSYIVLDKITDLSHLSLRRDVIPNSDYIQLADD